MALIKARGGVVAEIDRSSVNDCIDVARSLTNRNLDNIFLNISLSFIFF